MATITRQNMYIVQTHVKQDHKDSPRTQVLLLLPTIRPWNITITKGMANSSQQLLHFFCDKS